MAVLLETGICVLATSPTTLLFDLRPGFGTTDALKMRSAIWVVLTALLVAGCGRSGESSGTSSKAKVIARWRLAGGQALRGQTNAPVLRDVLTLPESVGVGSRMGTNLSRFLLSRWGRTNIAATEGQLYPLVEALMERESAGEITDSGWVLAIRGSDVPGAVLVPALSLFPRAAGVAAPSTLTTNGWWMAASTPADLARAATLPTAVPGGLMLGEFNLPILLGPGHEEWPTIQVTVGTSNATVRTSATLDFAKAPLGELEPWKLPEDFIRDPLIRFNALRGTGPLIDRVGWLRSLAGGSSPGQVIGWAQPEVTFRNWFAFPVDEPNSRIEKIHTDLKARFKTNDPSGTYMGRIIMNTNRSAVAVFDLKACLPTIGTVKQGAQSFLMASFVPGMKSTNRMPAELAAQINRPNLAFYEWEITGESAKNWNVLAQFNQLSQARMPNPFLARAFRWMLASAPKLGNSVTQVERRSATQYQFTRKSDTGLSGLDWVLLTRWIDSGYPGLNRPMPSFPVTPGSKP
jgi:hypothetical protein